MFWSTTTTTTTTTSILRPLLGLLVALLIVPSLLVSWHLWDQHWRKLLFLFRAHQQYVSFADNNNILKGLRISSVSVSVSVSTGNNPSNNVADDHGGHVAVVPPVGIFVPPANVVPHNAKENRRIMNRVIMSSSSSSFGGDVVELAQRILAVPEQQQPNDEIWLQPKSEITSASSGTGWCLMHLRKTNENGQYQDREDEWCQKASESTVAFSSNNRDWTGDYYYQYEATNETKQNVVLHVQELFPSRRSWFPFFFFGSDKSRQHQAFPRTTTTTNPKLSPLQQALLVHPATTFWLTLNVVLAFIYWNSRIPVSAVAQVVYYPQLQQQLSAATAATSQPDPQIWRLLTGASAHFELWHLGFNMMSLSALGQQLENNGSNGNGKYTSIEFWLYNGSVLVWTGVVWMGLQYGIQRFFVQSRNTNQHHQGGGENHRPALWTPRPTVGFSSVLFAWMVVAALENQVSCPIPFMPSVCFHAFHIGNSFQFNWGPVVTLVLMQLILPRASWTGHLAGVLVGFAMHWGVLSALLLHPAVALPGLYYLYLRFVRRIVVIPSNNSSSSRWDALEGSEDDDGGSVQQQPTLLLCPTPLLLLHGTTFLLSVFAYGLWSSLTVSYFGVFLFVHLFIRMGGLGDVTCGREQPTMIATRGLLLSAVMVQVADAMTAGAWLTWIQIEVWQNGRVGHDAVLVFSVILLRSLMLLSTVFLSVRKLVPVREETGIFYYIFYYTVLSPCESILTTAASSSRRGSSFCPSPQPPIRRGGDGDAWSGLGSGRRLGGGRETSATPHSSNDGNERELSQLL